MTNEKMKHSRNFDKYKKHYDDHFWNNKMLRNVTKRGALYDWEYEEITGEPFETADA